MKRPPLSSSTVSASLAVRAGLRKLVASTRAPADLDAGDGDRERPEHRPAFPGALWIPPLVVDQDVIRDLDRIELDCLGHARHGQHVRPTR